MPIQSPSIEQAYLHTFQNNFYTLAEQKATKLLNSPAISYMDIKGLSNVSRIVGGELEEVTGTRNPEKKYADMNLDNRKSKARRFTRTYLIDSYDKCVNLITDPTSNLFQILQSAKNRITDRVIIEAATGTVVIGKPDEAGTVLSPADDGVMTLDGTSAFGYSSVISPAITNFENNNIDCSKGCTLALSANEKQDLRDDDKYMNAFYSSNNTVDKGDITNASGFNIVSFAGSVNGGKAVTAPILPETEGIRTNVLMAPDSIGLAVEVALLDAKLSDRYVNSYEITIDYWVKALRLEGEKIQILKSTI